METLPENPSPSMLARKFDTPVQDDGPSSPIRPVMALKRKLRDADTLSQRLQAQIPPENAFPIANSIRGRGNVARNTDGEQPLGPNHNDIEAMYRPMQNDIAPNESRQEPGVDSLRSFLHTKESYKRRPVVNWAVPINSSRPSTITGPGGYAKQFGVEKSKGLYIFPLVSHRQLV
jgi:hypothetical protein